MKKVNYSKFLEKTISNALKLVEENLTDPVPSEIRQKYNLCHKRYAIENIHFPESNEAIEIARKRLYKKDEVILAADTIVWHHGRIYGKPHSQEEAYAMLHSLSGRTHEVYTGVTVLHNGTELTEHECTYVTFRSLSDEEIHGYIATGEPMDKAGAYGAQGIGALFVKRIEGDFFNVMGLPVCRLGEMLKRTGVKLL